MTRDELEKTPWAIAFKADAPFSYSRAIDLALRQPLEVEIVHTNERMGTHEWAIIVVDETISDFWMDAFERYEDALTLCKTMGWEVV